MKLKKVAASVMVMALVVTASSTSAFAYHGSKASKAQVQNTSSYAVCQLEDCAQAGSHEHNGTTYYAHHNEDGHTYHNREHADGNHNGSYGHH